MLELEKLVFEVDTSQLQKAEQHLLDLGVAVQKVNRPVNETAKSTENLGKQSEKAAKLLQREADALEFMNKGFSRGHASRLAYAKSLGISTKALEENLKAQAALTNSKYMDRMARDVDAASKGIQKSVDHITRALGPQLTDVFVGLATGQSPFMILAQQGGQISDQLQLAGVAGKNMSKQLVDAAKITLENYKNVAMAIGGLFVEGFKQAGIAVANGLVAPYKAALAATKDLIYGTNDLEGSIKNLKDSMNSLKKAGLIALLITLAALAVEYVKISSLTRELSDSLLLTGAALGMSKDSAVEFAEGLSSVGYSTKTGIKVLTDFAKAGVYADDSLADLTASAMDMQKYLGVAYSDTAKKIVQAQQDPIDSLIKLGKETGFVSVETIKQAKALEEMGDKAGAAVLAVDSLQSAFVQMVDSSKQNLDPLQKLWIDIKSSISGASEALYDLLKSETVVNVFRTAWEAIAVTVSEVWFALKQTGKEIYGIGTQIAAVMTGDFAGAKRIGETMKTDAAAARVEQEKLIQSILNRNKVQAQGIALADSERKKNSAAASAYEAMLKKKKEPKSNAEKIDESAIKDLIRIRKQTNELTQDTENLSDAQKLALDIFASEKFKLYSDARKIQISEELQSLHNQEIVTKGILLNAKLTVEENARNNVALNTIFNTFGKNKEFLKEQNAEIAFQQSLFGKSTEEANKLTKEHQSAKDALSIQKRYEQDILTIKTQYWKMAGENESNIDYASMQADIDKLSKQEKLEIGNVKLKLSMELDPEFKRFEKYREAFEDMTKGMSDALVDFALTGKSSFGDMIQSMLVGLLKFEMQAQMSTIMREAGGLGSFMKFFGFNTSTGSVDYANAVNSEMNYSLAQANGGAWDSGIQAFAKGGTFTNSIVNTPTMFKFAKGTGLMGEAGPEAIMPLKRDASGSLGVAVNGGSGSNVEVIINNNSSAQATAQETTDSRGNRRIEVTIGDMVAGEVSRTGSSTQKAMNANYGLRQQLIRR